MEYLDYFLICKSFLLRDVLRHLHPDSQQLHLQIAVPPTIQLASSLLYLSQSFRYLRYLRNVTVPGLIIAGAALRFFGVQPQINRVVTLTHFAVWSIRPFVHAQII
jgi:hypothetical protein